MSDPTTSSTPGDFEPAYKTAGASEFMLLPAPEMLATICSLPGNVSTGTRQMIRRLGLAAATADPAAVIPICAEILSVLQSAPSRPNGKKEKSEIYDTFFGVQRLATQASKDEIVRTIVASAARTLRTGAMMQQAGSAVSAIEFGALRMAYAAIADALLDLGLDIL